MENAFGQPQTLIVLGGTSDIARGLTKKLAAARTHTVVLAGRSQSLLDEASQEATTYGAATVDTAVFDANDVADAGRVVSECFDKVDDTVDLVVVAIGLMGDQFEKEDDATLAGEVATVNFSWPVSALAETRRRLVAQGSGRILVISSVAAVRVRRSLYLYGGAKAGLDRLCQGMADSLEGTGVRLQLVRPGVVRTRMAEGLPKVPFTTDVDEAVENILKGLANGDPVIWSPPILRYVFMILRHVPRSLWRKVMDR
jgi:decaprenylphospho-beta-D-erythro-pentofuranosid-2-ulose 2-reductase